MRRIHKKFRNDGSSIVVCSAGHYASTDCRAPGRDVTTQVCTSCKPLTYQCAGPTNLDLSQCLADGSAWGPVSSRLTICDVTYRVTNAP